MAKRSLACAGRDETNGQRRTKKSRSAATRKRTRAHTTSGKESVKKRFRKKKQGGKKTVKDTKQALKPKKGLSKPGQQKGTKPVKGETKPKELPLVVRAKKHWERLRKHDMKKEERVKVLNQLLELVTSHIHELVLKHDGARVIQCLLKYGSEQVRGMVYAELKDHIPELCRVKYAKFTIKAMLKYCPSLQRDGVIAGMYGHVTKLVRHKEAAEIIEAAYNDHANAIQRALLTQEFFGPQYSLFKKKTGGDMASILSAHPDKKKLIETMKQSLCPLLDKGVVKHSIVHHALLEFFLHADQASKADMIELVRDSVVEMLHTREGAKVALHCLWYGSVKDRKAIVKSFKTYVSKICKEESGHIVLLGMFDCVDDTVLIKKVILSEMIGSLEELCDHKIGRRVLLYLLNPRCSLHFSPQFISLLTPGDSNQHSKKPADVRWGELREAVSGPLIELATLRATQWSRSKPHAPLLIQIASSATGDVSPVYDSLCLSLCVDPDHEAMDDATHLVNDDCGHWTIRRILALGQTHKGDSPLLASMVLDNVPVDQLLKWAESNRGCFVLCSLVENVREKERVVVVKMLSPLINRLSSCSHDGGKVLLQKLSQHSYK